MMSRVTVARDQGRAARAGCVRTRRAPRRRRGPAAAQARSPTAVLDAARGARRRRPVTAYVSRASEPGTEPLLRALTARGVRVLLPVLVEGCGWTGPQYEGADDLVPCALPGNGSLLEPPVTGSGRTRSRRRDVVLAPGLAVGADGTRMGFGGGCYDRALARGRPGDAGRRAAVRRRGARRGAGRAARPAGQRRGDPGRVVRFGGLAPAPVPGRRSPTNVGARPARRPAAGQRRARRARRAPRGSRSRRRGAQR